MSYIVAVEELHGKKELEGILPQKLALQTLWLPPHIMRDAVIQQLHHDMRTHVHHEHGQNSDHVVMAESLLNRKGENIF